jgi:hypothetical protein
MQLGTVKKPEKLQKNRKASVKAGVPRGQTLHPGHLPFGRGEGRESKNERAPRR